ncbi:hypothetical protein N0V88_003818 [Collariella sp. IMI 366227]|nr:hypothetical protein N0V88_003818 [Collariella sp. IMI 366227]
MEQQIPLSHEASAGDTNMRKTTTLPTEVVQCLDNARFLHLATCLDNVPHVSLMNFSYLESSPYSRSPVIIMTTNPASKKMNNLVSNPNVSLLGSPTAQPHPRRLSADGAASRSPNREPHSSLAALLFNLNTSAMSSISATINGSARLVEGGSEEEAYYRKVHLENNTFDAAVETGQTGAGGAAAADWAENSAGSRFAAGEEVRVIVVGVRDVRIADWKGNVRDWVIEAALGEDEDRAKAVNGVQ